MTETLRKLLDVLDPKREERGVINFDQHGGVNINVDRALKSQQDRHDRLIQKKPDDKNESTNGW